MTYANGKIPATAMVALSVGGRLLPAAASNFEAWRAAASRAGYSLSITSAADAFRSYEIQERIFLDRFTLKPLTGRPIKHWQGRTWWLKPGHAMAAVPGTSNHGKGLAVDIRNAGGFTGAFYRWMAQTGPEYGWSNTEGRAINEPWHWVNDGRARGGTIGGAIGSVSETTSEEDEDMPLSNDDLVKILEAKFLVSPGRAVSLSQALGAVYFYGDRINDLIGALEGKVDGLPSKVWTHPLPRTVGKGDVSTGDLLRFESAEHANTRTLIEKLAAIPDGVDLSRIEKAVQDALAAGVNVHVTTGGKS